MKRPNRPKDLARHRALIRRLIEQSTLAETPPQPRRDVASNVEYLWDAKEAAHLPPPAPLVPANIIPFPNLRDKSGS